MARRLRRLTARQRLWPAKARSNGRSQRQRHDRSETLYNDLLSTANAAPVSAADLTRWAGEPISEGYPLCTHCWRLSGRVAHA